MLTIEKIADGRAESTIRVPAILVRILCIVLPASGHAALQARGVHLAEIVRAGKTHVPYQTAVAFREKAVDKLIVLRLD